MYYLNSFLKTTATLFLFVFCSYSQEQLPLENGKLEGSYQNYDSLTGLTTFGSFHNNTRSGEWTIKEGDGKYVYQRIYESFFSFNEKKTYQNKASHSNYKHPVERNDEGLYIYPEINNSNVSWSKRVWSILPEKHHGQLYSQEVLVKISEWVEKGKIKVYKDDEISKLISEKGFNVSDQKIQGVTIKKDYYFDKSIHLMQERVVAITFHLKDDKTGGNRVFSIYYPTNGRKLLSSFNVQNESERIEHYDDHFFFQNYVDIIYNEENAYGRRVDLDFSDIDQYQETSSDIKMLILIQEHRFWLEG
jgi:hypothetical protein